MKPSSTSFKRLFIGVISLNLLCACSTPIEDNTSSSIDTSSSSSSEINSSETTHYEKDEQGFYILEDDYFSYNYDEDDNKTESEVYIPNTLEDVDKYSQLRMYIGDRQVPLYQVKTNMSQTWTAEANSRQNNSYTTIGLKGKITIKLQASFNFMNNVSIRPLDREVPFEIDANRRVLTFTISEVGQYVIEMRSGRALHLFVEDISIMKNENPNYIYFAPGVHRYDNDNRINKNNVINLSSNQKVFLAPGALIYGKFLASNSSNIEIIGPGYIDGSIFERNPNNGTVLVPVEFNNCSNITLKDFACIDPAGWAFNIYFCNNVIIDNVKIISSRSNGDGISIQSCQNVEVTNSFIRSWDDSLVVKNYPLWSNRSIEGTTRHIRFSNCLIWTDLAQSMEIGYETVGEVMEDITFDNICVLHNFHKAIISIHNGNNANIKDIHFTNITIEDADVGNGDGWDYIVDIRNIFTSNWSTNHKITAMGQIDGVEISNIKVLDGIDNPKILINGCVDNREEYNNSLHYVKNINFTDFSLYGEILTNDFEGCHINEYVENVTFSSTGNPINGATFTQSDLSEYGNNYIYIN